MCVSCGHKCTQFPDKPSVPEDQDLEEVARGLYAAGTISFKLPTTTASALPADSFGATAGATFAPMGAAVGNAGTGRVGWNSIMPPSAATYNTAPRATPQYTYTPNTTTPYAPTHYYSAPRTIAPNTPVAYAPTRHTTAPYTAAPYTTAPYTTAPYTTATHTFAPSFTAPAVTAQPPNATPAPSTPIPEPQLQPTNLLLFSKTASGLKARPDLHALYMGQDNEEYRYPEPSREGYYMALSRRRRG
ncbi:hypothetical protein NU219Hw_g2276t1 [Hortaea werneckii]